MRKNPRKPSHSENGKSSYSNKPRKDGGSDKNSYTKEPSQRQGRQRNDRNSNPRFLYGTHATTHAILNPKRSIHRILVTEAGAKTLRSVLVEAQNAGLKRPNVQIMDKYELENMVPAGAVHQGIILDAAPLKNIDLEDLCEELNGQEKSLIVILDQVTDPHNIGAILRSASAFGVDGIVTQERNAPEITGTLAKIACGAVEHTPILKEINLARSIEYLQEQGYICIGLAEEGLYNLSECPKNDKCVIILGAEGDGLRHLIAKKCDMLARLPTQGAIGSLNVSNAAAVAFYEMGRNDKILGR